MRKRLLIPFCGSPLKLRRDLRDHWEGSETPAQKAIADLIHVCGLPVDIDFDVSILWTELQKYFPDQDTFVSTIVRVLKSWTDCLRDRLSDDINAGWTEKFLAHLEEYGRKRLSVKIEVCGSADSVR